MSYLINGREYEWADLTLIAGGRDMVEFRGISWKKKIERDEKQRAQNKLIKEKREKGV